ncbi:cysteine--tRNA ligase [Hydrogenovibrio halophilus]|uniref:cysteine--tRNA ligase n=1 Tax=Hydrogenovibrio halophilus TaxID=373391 RepID=UPI000362C47B|nr:cysteine--tRNA ligase [Hydrogenovibrio halophilus]
MSLKIYNTETRKKAEFEPIEPGKVGLYVCGVTVYDYCHVGHARVMVVFDTVVRHLRAQGYDVTYVRNITDIDDKIIQRALENKESVQALTERFVEAMHEDEAALNVLRPDQEPRATAYMDQIEQMIATLIEKGHAYAADNGDVYFHVKSDPDYGRLSGKTLDELVSGSRVEVNSAKQDPLDFVLWKASKPEEPAWPSPWGDGRPGWHIECSAMATHCLGKHFDIHGGGLDLSFPHHENEIAQSECATGEHYVNTWMHCGFVRIDDEKMSKSLGNFFTIREVLKLYHPEVVRYFLLASHYRSPVNYSEETLESAKASLDRLYTALDTVPDTEPESGEGHPDNGKHWVEAFEAAMNDDFNTPQALAVLFDLSKTLNKTPSTPLLNCLRELGARLGLLAENPQAFFKWQPQACESDDSALDEARIESLIEERAQARQNKDFARADAVRDQLLEAGIELLDGPEGTRWRRV